MISMKELMGHLLSPVKPYWPAKVELLLLAWENLAILVIKLLPPWRVRVHLHSLSTRGKPVMAIWV